jgi:hypothetical protein
MASPIKQFTVLCFIALLVVGCSAGAAANCPSTGSSSIINCYAGVGGQPGEPVSAQTGDSKQNIPAAPGAICVTYNLACTQALANASPSGGICSNSSIGTIKIYDFYMSPADCQSELNPTNSFDTQWLQASGNFQFCITNNCNAPPSSPGEMVKPIAYAGLSVALLAAFLT